MGDVIYLKKLDSSLIYGKSDDLPDIVTFSWSLLRVVFDRIVISLIITKYT